MNIKTFENFKKKYYFDMVYVPSGEVFRVEYSDFQKFYKTKIGNKSLCYFDKKIDKWVIPDKFREDFKDVLMGIWN